MNPIPCGRLLTIETLCFTVHMTQSHPLTVFYGWRGESELLFFLAEKNIEAGPKNYVSPFLRSFEARGAEEGRKL